MCPVKLSEHRRSPKFLDLVAPKRQKMRFSSKCSKNINKVATSDYVGESKGPVKKQPPVTLFRKKNHLELINIGRPSV